MITCERCGNDFNWGKRVERDGRLKVLCPYCYQPNDLPRKKSKKKKLDIVKDDSQN